MAELTFINRCLLCYLSLTLTMAAFIAMTLQFGTSQSFIGFLSLGKMRSRGSIPQSNAGQTSRDLLTHFESVISVKPSFNLSILSKLDKPDPKLKKILLWTTFYKDPYYGMLKFGQFGFVNHNCPVNACTITNDRDVLSTTDAVVVHMRNPDMNPLPKRHHPTQLFVFYLFEAPPASFFNARYIVPEESRGIFNMTITYRFDSDISIPSSGTVVPRDNAKKTPYTPRIPLANRTGTVVWVASHCITPGKREKYIHALSQHIDVDIYGRCGTLNCSAHHICSRKWDSKYKFYVSAENAVCTDYVTEKLNTALNGEIIPLVYGGFDYKEHLPPHSYIDITTFPSPKKLADYLNFLLENESKYWEYFEWKGRYRRVGKSKGSTMCKLCEALHDPIHHKVYPDVVKWWTRNVCNTNFMDKMIAEGHV